MSSEPADFRCLYRLQLTPGFGFAEARRVLPYVRALGVSHLYLSPVLEARTGSTHGYDVTDPRRVRAELGGEEELRRLAEEAPGIVLDLVPNHMAVDDANPFWPDPKVFDLDPESGRHRRFFSIDELAGVRQEDPEVFELTHAKALELVRDGVVEGLRIDHPDGLVDPRGYLERLRAEGVRHVWVEKILEPGEPLRDWPVEGTTGYEFLSDVTQLFVDPRAEERLTRLYRELTGETRSFAEVAREAKLEQAATTFAPEVERLRRLWDAPELERSLAALDVYRTYVEPWSGRVADEDRRRIEAAGLPRELARTLLLEGERSPERDEFVARFQQTTGPVHAKGVEDSACYRYWRLAALNEVGCDPGRFGLDVEHFHREAMNRVKDFPGSLLTTYTHDTKRSDDVRARLVALTWLPEEWEALVRSLPRPEIDPNDAYMALQTVVGSWGIAADRIDGYVEKALREGGRTSCWASPDEDAERRVQAYARELQASADVERFAKLLRPAGQWISLGMQMLKLTSPGVPDVYQGDDMEVLTLVDPDNRLAVDWERRFRAIGDPSPKLAQLLHVLAIRNGLPEAFAGAYEPVDAGPDAVAFVRGGRVRVTVPLRPGGGEPTLELLSRPPSVL
ncbi:MAG TPA: alpha-amylase family glycosyl hydrolase [Gaiellaceae bacterium]|nr:alpha-amylase family glycosyl hydrolase [Gaiellaceae bacterium]